MKNHKSVWLPLALPLLLVGCGDNTEVVIEPVSSSAVNIAETENDAGLEISITEDQVEQVDTINNTLAQIEALPPVLTIDDSAEATTSITNAAELTEPEIAAPVEPMVEPVSVPAEPAETGLNGNYEYEVTYFTPGGATEMTVSFLMENSVITDVSMAGNPQHSTSIQYQRKLQTGLDTLIVGKELTAVDAVPSKTSGSSLTPKAFNDALAQLQAEA
jgi:hypothetical protein